MAAIGHEHSIHHVGEHGSYVWDISLAPAAEVESGSTVELGCADAAGSQRTNTSITEDVGNLDPTRVNPGHRARPRQGRPDWRRAGRRDPEAEARRLGVDGGHPGLRAGTYGHARQEAYALASVAADLRIREIVDVPHWTVGAFLPEAVFTEHS